jgi:TetR/AcrR family transcriptional regulator
MVNTGSDFYMKSKMNQDPGKREQILLAAEHVFADRGFKGTTTREVAEQAGIASSLIFYYFKNKMALYEAVFQNFFEQLEELMQQNLSLDLDRLGKLKRFLFTFTDFASGHRNMMRILLREIIDNGRIVQKVAQDYFKPLYEIGVDFLKEGQREALFKEVDPLHYIHSFIGMNLFYFIGGPAFLAAGAEDPYGAEEVERRKIEVWNAIRSSLM